ncbi:DUF6447 family protein [Thiorhodovibrio frisius]|uniref:Uncharacterized protein n=1 Tax=Thiorhodovibrio frisius TaxID=631362 RepID=H8YWY1_9GAMM|nr:DUF6447 family protein [Thiorhodovibrio frisius]EIC22957.1 hypothetical protein Thi970DRAFT_00600 [Thiorhodovibrio frisius]WPL22781.1 hypothetical protein Thiofri_02953 [Thiorhodovibrio frisius]
MPEQTPTVTINDKSYKLDDLSEKAKQQLVSLRVCDQQITYLQQQLAITQTARASYARVLHDELPPNGR